MNKRQQELKKIFEKSTAAIVIEVDQSGKNMVTFVQGEGHDIVDAFITSMDDNEELRGIVLHAFHHMAQRDLQETIADIKLLVESERRGKAKN